MDVVDRWRDVEKGWRFDSSVPGTTADTVNGCSFIREIYFLADENYNVRLSDNTITTDGMYMHDPPYIYMQ